MQGASQKATEKGTGIKVQNDNGESNINYNQSLTVFIHFCKALENTLSHSIFRETRGGKHQGLGVESADRWVFGGKVHGRVSATQKMSNTDTDCKDGKIKTKTNASLYHQEKNLSKVFLT